MTALREPFESLARQHNAALFGMWLFLATEVLFFGGLFGGYAVYRTLYPEGFVAGARHSEIVLGTVNTALLLTSSLCLAAGVRAARLGIARFARACFFATALLGCLFLAVKGWEYADDIAKHLLPGPDFALSERGAVQFWTFYWLMTGLHALHVLIGIGAVLRLPLAGRRDADWLRHTPAVEATALYWHFVDAIWVVLFPLLYLAGRA
jgi:cytochrome c oxidase subunit 3